jgi:hypothetical protein
MHVSAHAASLLSLKSWKWAAPQTQRPDGGTPPGL